MLPPIYPIGFSTILYLIFVYVTIVGFWQVYFKRLRNNEIKRSLVPLGAVALTISIIAYIQQYRRAFQAIEEVGDISPSVVAASLNDAFAYPTLGLLCLALSFLFKYLTQ